MAINRITRRAKVKARIRKKISGNPQKPRISVFRSNKHIYAQIIDDVNKKTLVSASSLNEKVQQKTDEINKSKQAEIVGKILAEKALNANIKNVVMDRSGYRYHGRIKAFAEGVRKGGLIF